MPSVHVLGAGPVGLATAIQIKMQAPGTTVRASEHHVKYKRQHIVRLAPESIKGMVQIPAFKALQTQLKKNSAIRTYDLENLLLAQARKLGIQILYEHIEDPRQILERFPDTTHIIGADGSHSVCRNRIFNNELRFKKPLQYAIEIKYEVSQRTRRLPTDKILELEEEFGSFRPIEYIGRYKQSEGVTPVTLWILVDEKTYEQMEEATFKTPYNLRQDSHKIPEKLLDSIHNWLGARFSHFQEVRSSERITRLKLDAYGSYQVVRNEKGVHWSLVGDAALGVPFFRSLNNGMISASLLATAIAQDILDSHTSSLRQQIKKQLICWLWKLLPSSLRASENNCSPYLKLYAIKQTWLAYKEYYRAFLKSWVIRLLNFLLWLKNLVANHWNNEMDLEPFNRPNMRRDTAPRPII